MSKPSFFTKGIVALAICAAMLTVVPASNVYADDLPSAQDVVDKYIDAIGGRDAVTGITSRTMKGMFSLVEMGMVADMEIYSQPPNAYTLVSLQGMGEVRNGIKDGVAWETHFMNGDSVLEGQRQKDAEKSAALNEFVNWQNWYTTAEVTGEATGADQECYTVEFASEEGTPSVVYFAKESGLVVQREGIGFDGMPSVTIISDYRDVSGVQVPFAIETQGGMTVQITFDSVEHNAEISADQFNYPESIANMLNPPAPEAAAESDEGSDDK